MGKRIGNTLRRGREELEALGTSAARSSLKVQQAIKKKKKKKKQVRQEKHNAFMERVLARKEQEREATETRSPKKKKRRCGRALLELGALGEALDDVELVKKKVRVPKIMRSRTRTRLLEEEMEHFSSVLQHPAYKEDPMEALRLHLMNTVTQKPEAVPPAIARKRKKKKRVLKEEKEFRSGRQIRAAVKRKDRLERKARDAKLAAELAKQKEKRSIIGEKHPKILS